MRQRAEAGPILFVPLAFFQGLIQNTGAAIHKECTVPVLFYASKLLLSASAIVRIRSLLTLQTFLS